MLQNAGDIRQPALPGRQSPNAVTAIFGQMSPSVANSGGDAYQGHGRHFFRRQAPMMAGIEAFLSHISVGLFGAVVWWLALSWIVGWLAQGKGRNAVAFFAIALFFSPIVGLLAVIAVHDLKASEEANAANAPFKEMMVPLMLNIDGIRGHLTVSSESNRLPMPEAPPSPPRQPGPAGGSKSVQSPPSSAQAQAPSPAPSRSPAQAQSPAQARSPSPSPNPRGQTTPRAS